MNHTVLKAARLAAFCAISGVVPGSAIFAEKPKAAYTEIDLGPVFGGEGEAFAINNAGDVAGQSLDRQLGIGHATLWTNGVARDLGTLGGYVSAALAINDGGQVVGWSTASGWGPSHAFLWDGNSMRDLHPPGAQYLASGALGINNSGEIVGWYMLNDGGREHACMWRNGVFIDLPAAKTRSTAMAINERGDVAGFYSPGNSQGHAFLIRKGTLIDLTPQAFWFSWANAINNRGEVTLLGEGAFIYRNGSKTPIDISPRAINEPGQVAGQCYSLALGYWPCVWDAGQTTPPDVLDRNSFFQGINNRGDVAGSGIRNGKYRPLLWRRK